LKRFLQSYSLAYGHPIKGAALRSASLRDGFAALDWDPGLRQGALLRKRFNQKVFPWTPWEEEILTNRAGQDDR